MTILTQPTGVRFAQKHAQTNADYLAAAEQVHTTLEQHKVVTEDGIYWTDATDTFGLPQGSPDLSLYTGSAGQAYYYLELYKATNKPEYEHLALEAARYLSLHWREQIAVASSFLGEESASSFYLGVTSIGQVLYQFYQTYQYKQYRTALAEIAYKTIALAKTDEAGLFWSEDESPLLGGGATIFLYRAGALLNDEDILSAANKAADGILARSVADERGGLAWTSYAHPGQTRVPNFECGTAGVGYALTVAYEISGDKKYLEAAQQAAEHLRIISIPVGNGYLVPFHDNPNEDTIFYVATCHGPAGTSRLFYQLYKLTGDESYLHDITSFYQGLKALGVPEQQSPGYWNNVSICCGTAGLIQFFINVNLVTKSEEVLQQAQVAGDILLGSAEQSHEGKGIVWPLAFERVRPDYITTSISYGAGATGIALALLQLYLRLENTYTWDRFFDDPYPAHQ